MGTASVERELLSEAGTGLAEVSDRLWVAGMDRPDTYPTEAHRSLAQIEENSFWFGHRNDVISAVLKRFPLPGPILDIGGGNGFVSRDLARRGHSCIVVEPGNDAASTAHCRGLTVINAAFDRTLFREGSISAIGLFDVLEHIEDDHGFLRDCLAVLAPGRFVYVTVPAFQFLWSADDVYAKHCRRYNRALLTDTLAKAGFEVCFASYFFSLLVPPLYLLRTLPSALGLRRVTTPRDALEHHREGSFLSDVARRALAFERSAIARGVTLPFGTSLIAAARKRSA